MPCSCQEYLIPDGTSPDSIRALIARGSAFTEDAETTTERRFFDTFDWALYNTARALEERRRGKTRSLVLHDLRGEQPALIQPLDVEPGFAWDLTEGPVREAITDALSVRRLLPLVKLKSHADHLCQRNENDKTVVRLSLETHCCIVPNSHREAPLTARLSVIPVKGYDQEAARACTLLSELRLETAQTHVLLDALAACEKQPGAYSSKLAYQLDPHQRADAATKQILLGLLETLEANIDGARRNLDSEFLHDLRVACRRTRSALTQIKGVFPPAIVADFKDRFAWLQQVTGPVRDLDVYLLDFEDYRDCLPERMRADLTPFKDYLAARYDEQQRRLAKALASKAFSALLRDWRAFLEAPDSKHAAAVNAVTSIERVASTRIRKLWKRVRAEGRAIHSSSPPEQLHELRKSCKKLRYLIEFFQSLYPSDEIRVVVKQTKVLLDNLGRFQDLAVQAHHLRDLAQQVNENGHSQIDTVLAMGVLVGNLLNHQQAARREFSDIFATVDTPAIDGLFKRLFVPRPHASETPT